MKVVDLKDLDFEDLLNSADVQASTSWEQDFMEGIVERYEKYGDDMYISDKQLEYLEKIANKS